MSVPLFLLGKHTTLVKITPGTIAANGTITWVTGSAVTFTTLVENISDNLSAVNQDIRPTNSTRHNNVVTSDGFTITMRTLRPHDGTANRPLAGLFKGWDVFKVEYTQGSSTGSVCAVEAHVTRTDYSAGHDGEGAQYENVTWSCVDSGSVNFFKTTIS